MSLSATLMSGRLGRAIRVVARLHDVISLLCVFAPLVYLSVASFPEFVEPTRISENALLPGLVNENWRNQAEITKSLEILKTIENEKKNDNRGHLVLKQLKDFGLEAYSQRFHSNLTRQSGTNVVGVVRAVRATPGEAILLTVRLDSDQHHAIAVALSLARQSNDKNYWARDLIFLFVDGVDPQTATLAWLSAYNGEEPHKFVKAEELPTHSGTIVGGMVLDLAIPEFTHFHLHYIGINGLLPNLDVFNLFVRLCEKHNVEAIIQNHNGGGNRAHAETLWRGVLDQAFNELEGIHSVLNHYRIHSVTLKATRDRQHRPHSLESAALIVEAGFRSLNNILEKLHQSYFFYLLVSPHHFLSIAYYFPALAIQTFPFLLQQFRAYSSIRGFDTPLITWATCQLTALAVYFAHVKGFEWSREPGNQLNVFFGSYSEAHWAIAIVLFNLFWPMLFAGTIRSHSESAIIRCLFFNGLTIVMLCVGLLNISTGLYLGLYLLISHIVTRLFPWNNWLTRLVYCLLMSPITFYTLTVGFATYFQLWPTGLDRVTWNELWNLERIAVFLMHEGRRYLVSHLQHNTCNFLLFAFVCQISHAVFINLIGWEFSDPELPEDDKKLEEKKKR
ncbi:hypothetical protein M3Y94_00667800 [Aphelenchoides besseyi]|nr:hypothetical protein M3Y94_00667800 [Aphelenchoides besseyi]KAI6231308.1 hypothetical protein M3Y95_00368000 [Aphelenchoides besseyi]